MYAGRVETFEIDAETRTGFQITITTEDGEAFTFQMGNRAEALYDAVRREIGPWLHERDEAVRTRPEARDEAYALSDPKHPEFHSVHADIWDAKEGK